MQFLQGFCSCVVCILVEVMPGTFKIAVAKQIESDELIAGSKLGFLMWCEWHAYLLKALRGKVRSTCDVVLCCLAAACDLVVCPDEVVTLI